MNPDPFDSIPNECKVSHQRAVRPPDVIHTAPRVAQRGTRDVLLHAYPALAVIACTSTILAAGLLLLGAVLNWWG